MNEFHDSDQLRGKKRAVGEKNRGGNYGLGCDSSFSKKKDGGIALSW